MALSDCDHCDSTPCSCGWKFKDYTAQRMATLVCYWPKNRIEELVLRLQATLPFRSNTAVHETPEAKLARAIESEDVGFV